MVVIPFQILDYGVTSYCTSSGQQYSTVAQQEVDATVIYDVRLKTRFSFFLTDKYFDVEESELQAP